MTRNGSRIIYANQSSDEFGVFVGHIQTINEDTNDEETNIIQSKNRFKNTWDFHGLEQSAPLKFKMTLIKLDGTYIDSNDQRMLKKWLCKSNFNWLQVEQDDLNDINYFCIITNPRPVNVGVYTGGLEVDITCNSGIAWSEINKKSYTSNTTYTFNFNLITDYDDYILSPIATIKPTSDGNISIKNNTTNKTITINNCVTTETIIMDGNKDIIESSNNRVLLDSWNKQFLEIISGSNSITLTGNFTMILEYRLPIRIGG